MAYISNNNPDKIHRKRHWRNEGTEEKRAGNNKDTWESHLRPSTCAVPQLYLTAPCSQDLLFMGDFFFKGRIAKLWLCTVEAKQKTPLVSKMLWWLPTLRLLFKQCILELFSIDFAVSPAPCPAQPQVLSAWKWWQMSWVAIYFQPALMA